MFRPISTLAALLFTLPAYASMTIEAHSVGVDEKSAQVLVDLVLSRVEVTRQLSGARYRVLRTFFGDSIPEKERDARHGPAQVRLQVYDYSHDRLFEIDGPNGESGPLDVRMSQETPTPTGDELQDALGVLRTDPYFAQGLSGAHWNAKLSMPGVLQIPGAGRVIAVDLVPDHRACGDGEGEGIDDAFPHEIVGVDLSKLKIIRFPGGAPPTAVANRRYCGPLNANEPVTGYGLAGQAQITLKQGDDVLWQFQVVRPSGSAGFRGSGIDLRNVFYKGKKVFGQAHLPILNVRYDGDICGPYRDWQYSENRFVAHGKYITYGILQADEPARTIFDTNTDGGNFNGVAIYNDGDSTVLVSELNAGWYRYLAEWRFSPDGTIQPRWGFAAVQDSCTCNSHRHHAYWRLDFDIDKGPNRIQVFDGTQWSDVAREARQYRDAQHQKYRVINPATGLGYELTPGDMDGTAEGDAYAKGDMWLLKFNQNEIDDQYNYLGTTSNINAFVNGENLLDTDVVVWYAAHFHHVQDGSPAMEHILGPTLKPIGY